MQPTTYRMYPLWRVQILATFAIFLVAAVVLVVLTVTGSSGPPLWFVVFWLLALTWNAYWLLFRIAYRLDLSESTLEWRTPVRSGTIALADLREMRPQRVSPNIEVLVLSDGAKVLVIVRKGFVDFMAEVQRFAPHVQARVGTFARFRNRLPGPSGFRGHG